MLSSHIHVDLPRLPNQNPVNTSPLPHVCHMSCPPKPRYFNCHNNIQWRIQVTKCIIMQFSPLPVFLPFRSKYSQHCSQKPSVHVPPSEWDTKFNHTAQVAKL
jgi:hypothetical protein